MKKIIESYARFITKHPLLIIGIVIIVTILASKSAENIKNVSSDYSDMLPEGYEVMDAFTIIGDNFGGSETAKIAIEVDPNYKGSNEKRDIRDPEIIAYIDLLSQIVPRVDDVITVTTPSDILTELNNGVLPKSKNTIIELSNNPQLKSYLSPDHTMALISIRLNEGFDQDELAEDLIRIINEVEQPPGIIVNVAGDTIADAVTNSFITSDMSRTSQFSMIGILSVLIIMFGALRYSLTPLATIGLGITWAFGFVGMIGMNMTPQTSGVVSMIMGIGIDFGIQIVARFKQELKKKSIENAMIKTLKSVLAPMAITTVAALIGFQAMSMGQLTMLADMGTMMGYGVAMCFLAAITVVPALLILFEKFYNIRQKWKISQLWRNR